MKSLRHALFSCCLLALCAGMAMAQQFGPWSAPVNLGPRINSAKTELSPAISKDGLSLFFVCMDSASTTVFCPLGSGIYVSQRDALDAPWSSPQLVMAGSDPTLSLDGHRMYFTAQGTSGLPGDEDIYVSRRQDKGNDFAWGAPEAPVGINGNAKEGSVTFFEDETTGVTYAYFHSNRAGGPGGDDIYMSTLQPDDTFSSPVLVPELSSSAEDRHVTVRRDGLEIFFISNRCGSLRNAVGNPSYDIWTSRRATTSDPWSPPVNIDADPLGTPVCTGLPPVTSNVNTGKHDNKPSLSFDGTTLYFGSAQRTDNLGVGCPNAASCYFDIWMTTREKLRGRQSKDGRRYIGRDLALAKGIATLDVTLRHDEVVDDLTLRESVPARSARRPLRRASRTHLRMRIAATKP